MIYLKKEYFDNSKTFEDFVDDVRVFFETSDAEDTSVHNGDNDVWIMKNTQTLEHPECWEVYDRLHCKSYFTDSLEEAMDCMFSWRRA